MNDFTRRILTLTALLVCVGAARAAAQEPDRLQRARAALPKPAAARLDQLLKTATARGLPTSPLVDKVLEGEAKQVPPDRILGVVAQLADNLGRARALLDDAGAPDADELTAVADALRRGVPDEAVRSLHRRQPARPVALAVVTLADLVQEGVPVQQALDMLQAWADRGGKPSELRELPAAVERLMRDGTLPAQAAVAVTRSMKGQAPGRPESPGKSDLAPGRSGKPDGPPIPPGAGPPPGKGKPPRTHGHG